MGTFERSFEVDGERFELYAQTQDAETTYQLVDEANLPIGQAFVHPPEEDVVIGLVRAVKARVDPAA
jgi:hypothetical protein